MDDSIYLLVDSAGTVHVTEGAESFEEVARNTGLSERNSQAYRFDLSTRRLEAGRATPGGAIAAQDYLNQRFGSPERLMAFAEEGHLRKEVLADLLSPESRHPYLEACARVERAYTDACIAR